jgi:transcriptional regulator PpsR
MSIKPDTELTISPVNVARRHGDTARVKGFDAPSKTLGHLDAAATATLVAAAADISLVVDRSGVILDLAIGIDPPTLEAPEQWRGRPLVDVVCADSRDKVMDMLATADAIPDRWRQINHPAATGADLPMQYCAHASREGGPIVVIGRDLQGVAALQQRLIETQQSLEQDYWRRRQVETRYRLLFQVASEAVVIVDARTQRVLEANPAAEALFALTGGELVGRSLRDCFDESNYEAVESVLTSLRVTGAVEKERVHIAQAGHGAMLSGSLLNQAGALLYLLRLSPEGSAQAAPARAQARGDLSSVLEQGPDAVAVTDVDGRILGANRAFLELAELASEEQARGESLERWLGRTNVDVKVLVGNLRQYGSIRHFATRMRGEYGGEADVEISAVALRDGEGQTFGFVIRDVGRRHIVAEEPGTRSVPKSIEQLTELVGRVPLKEVIRESSDVIERLCIEAALELTGDNRASAAEMLGLSRQSLYVKLRRHGLMHSDSEDR